VKIAVSARLPAKGNVNVYTAHEFKGRELKWESEVLELLV